MACFDLELSGDGNDAILAERDYQGGCGHDGRS